MPKNSNTPAKPAKVVNVRKVSKATLGPVGQATNNPQDIISTMGNALDMARKIAAIIHTKKTTKVTTQPTPAAKPSTSKSAPTSYDIGHGIGRAIKVTQEQMTVLLYYFGIPAVVNCGVCGSFYMPGDQNRNAFPTANGIKGTMVGNLVKVPGVLLDQILQDKNGEHSEDYVAAKDGQPLLLFVDSTCPSIPTAIKGVFWPRVEDGSDTGHPVWLEPGLNRYTKTDVALRGSMLGVALLPYGDGDYMAVVLRDTDVRDLVPALDAANKSNKLAVKAAETVTALLTPRGVAALKATDELRTAKVVPCIKPSKAAMEEVIASETSAVPAPIFTDSSVECMEFLQDMAMAGLVGLVAPNPALFAKPGAGTIQATVPYYADFKASRVVDSVRGAPLTNSRTVGTYSLSGNWWSHGNHSTWRFSQDHTIKDAITARLSSLCLMNKSSCAAGGLNTGTQIPVSITTVTVPLLEIVKDGSAPNSRQCVARGLETWFVRTEVPAPDSLATKVVTSRFSALSKACIGLASGTGLDSSVNAAMRSKAGTDEPSTVATKWPLGAAEHYAELEKHQQAELRRTIKTLTGDDPKKGLLMTLTTGTFSTYAEFLDTRRRVTEWFRLNPGASGTDVTHTLRAMEDLLSSDVWPANKFLVDVYNNSRKKDTYFRPIKARSESSTPMTTLVNRDLSSWVAFSLLALRSRPVFDESQVFTGFESIGDSHILADRPVLHVHENDMMFGWTPHSFLYSNLETTMLGCDGDITSDRDKSPDVNLPLQRHITGKYGEETVINATLDRLTASSGSYDRRRTYKHGTDGKPQNYKEVVGTLVGIRRSVMLYLYGCGILDQATLEVVTGDSVEAFNARNATRPVQRRVAQWLSVCSGPVDNPAPKAYAVTDGQKVDRAADPPAEESHAG